MSKRIAQLEDKLGSPLFDRIGRNVSLTEAGSALLPHARTIQAQFVAAEQAVRDLAGDVAGKLSLATSHHIGLHRLPPVLSHFSGDYPEVQIDIDFMDSEQAYDLTLHGDVELSVVTLAPQAVAQLVAQPIWQDPLDFMVQQGHELSRQRKLTTTTLSEYPAILPGLNTYTGQIVKGLVDQQRLPLQVSMASNYLETIRMMASVGLGWTVLPRTMCDDSLCILPLQNVSIGRTLGAVYHEGRSLSRAARAFLDVLESYGDDASA